MKRVNTIKKATYYIEELIETFPAKRIYYITDVKGGVGGHAHRDEDEIFIMVKGKCAARLSYKDRTELSIFKEGNVIYSPRMNWHEFSDFTEGAIMLVLSSMNYDPKRTGYINDLHNFLEEKNA